MKRKVINVSDCMEAPHDYKAASWEMVFEFGMGTDYPYLRVLEVQVPLAKEAEGRVEVWDNDAEVLRLDPEQAERLAKALLVACKEARKVRSGGGGE